MASTRPPSVRRTHLALLAPMLVLLLIGAWLRFHRIEALPSFVDEFHHINRAEDILLFQKGNPIGFSHGKLLLYYYLGLFWPESPGWLALSRLAVGVAALVTQVAVVATARALFGRRAVIPALAVAVLAPFAVFFERMALADPFAGMMAALTVWLSIKLAQDCPPDRRRALVWGAVVGLVTALTPLAKLVSAFMIFIPLAALVLLGEPPWRHGRDWRTGFRPWLRTSWRRYGPALIGLVTVGVLVWSLVGAAYVLQKVRGGPDNFLPRHVTDSSLGLEGISRNLEDTATSAARFLSPGLAALLLALTVLLLVTRGRAAGVFVVIWLLALWVPTIILGLTLRSRYLMPGLPALAVIYGGGWARLADLASKWAGRRASQAVTALALLVTVVWAVVFALPFDWNAFDDPAALDLPADDVDSYLSGWPSGWGTREAVAYLAADGERVDGRIPTAALLTTCFNFYPYLTDEFGWFCRDANSYPRQHIPDDTAEWTPLHKGLDTWPFVYLVTEYTGGTAPDETHIWELLVSYPRPRGGRTVDVWRVQRAG